MLVQQAIERWHMIGAIATNGDGKWAKAMPYAGEFISVGGSIKTLGTGAGTSSDFQLRNQTQSKDILSTVGAFEVNSATNLLEGAVVNQTNCIFAKGDVIDLDQDAHASGDDAADAVIEAVVVYFMDDV
jgi:hypothetical protein